MASLKGKQLWDQAGAPNANAGGGVGALFYYYKAIPLEGPPSVSGLGGEKHPLHGVAVQPGGRAGLSVHGNGFWSLQLSVLLPLPTWHFQFHLPRFFKAYSAFQSCIPLAHTPCCNSFQTAFGHLFIHLLSCIDQLLVAQWYESAFSRRHRGSGVPIPWEEVALQAFAWRILALSLRELRHNLKTHSPHRPVEISPLLWASLQLSLDTPDFFKLLMQRAWSLSSFLLENHSIIEGKGGEIANIWGTIFLSPAFFFVPSSSIYNLLREGEGAHLSSSLAHHSFWRGVNYLRVRSKESDLCYMLSCLSSSLSSAHPNSLSLLADCVNESKEG